MINYIIKSLVFKKGIKFFQIWRAIHLHIKYLAENKFEKNKRRVIKLYPSKENFEEHSNSEVTL